ncbi:uncharacterized protein LOC100366958 [Saccoglossus kowalevskii]|uniref:Uncharacterized protein LOC100366958 n=1 Tax=Saccoglossus kowalevskii TaxID=10224 RepID=A0ABM0M2T4_SACKO|nr:PREDICTED: uncharacterized protein LOC100366958 [Saccoglossus kowalevskii]
MDLPTSIRREDTTMQSRNADEERDGHNAPLPEDLLNNINRALVSRGTDLYNVFTTGNDLDLLLITTTALCKKGMDEHSELIKVFTEKTLLKLFRHIHDTYAIINQDGVLKDETIITRTEQLIDLIIIKLNDDYMPLLNLLAIIFDPCSRFYAYNESAEAKSLTTATCQRSASEPVVYAISDESSKPKGFLVDIINLFGNLGGFQSIKERFQRDPPPTIPVTAALLRPFGQCYEFLTEDTVVAYFVPVLDKTCEMLDVLSDSELQLLLSESEDIVIGEDKPDAINTIIVAVESIATRIPDGHIRYNASNMQLFRMKMTLRLKRARGLPYGRYDTDSEQTCCQTSRGIHVSNQTIRTAYPFDNKESNVELKMTEDNVCVAEFRVVPSDDVIEDVSMSHNSNYANRVCPSDIIDNSQNDSLLLGSADNQSMEGATAVTIADATPAQNGEHYTSFFDITDGGSRHKSGRWSANSSDISGVTSKTYSVRSSGHDVCRFCYEGDQTAGNRMVRPCHCSGSAAYVHSRCLKKWIHFSRNTQCEVCHSHFSYIPYSERIRAFLEEFRRNKRWRNATFATLVGLVVLLYLVIFAVFPGGIIDI